MMKQKQIEDIEIQKEEMRVMLDDNMKTASKIMRLTPEQVAKKIEDILARTVFIPRC